MEVDLNCDLGEGAGNDAAIVPLITSANISCGFHAGSAGEALATIALAKQYGVTIGAHPGHADREHWGRRELPVPPAQVHVECVYQIGALFGVARVEQARISYLKPHGGLYHQANRDDAYADAVVEAARLFNLVVVGLPSSRLEARSRGRCPFVAEGFADRAYRPDGSLVPRDQPGAMIDDPAAAVAQVQRLLRDCGVRTICVHGDNPRAVAFVQALGTALRQQGFRLRPFA
jgi:5-oxoprolinase (ATP-hydrolysing) subunit A